MGLTYYRAGDEELIRGCLRGDPVAQQRLYETYSPKMYTYCLRYLKDKMLAEDALVTAFTRILQRIHQFKGEGSLEGWIKTIVIRESLATLRRNQSMRFESDLGSIETSTITQPVQDDLQVADLMRMVGELPVGYRTVFNLYAIDGYSHKEIAGQLGISENTSKSQLNRARAALQQKLALIESQLSKAK
jgi:RNA polymerase sigma-70 factor (ECF subfamily)